MVSWITLGVGASLAAGTTVARHRLITRTPQTSTDIANLNDSQLLAILTPSKLSLGVSTIVGALSAAHLCGTSFRHITQAMMGVCLSIGLGHTVTMIAGDVTVRVPMSSLWWREEKVGTLVRNGGLTLTGMWLTSQIAQEMACFFAVTSIGLMPVVDEVAETVHLARGRIMSKVLSITRAVHRHAQSHSESYRSELGQLWDKRNLPQSVDSAECLTLLVSFVQQRSHEIQRHVISSLRSGGLGGGLSEGCGIACAGSFCFLMNRWMLVPWADMNRQRSITKNEYLGLYDRCCINTLGCAVALLEQREMGFRDVLNTVFTLPSSSDALS